MNVGRKHTVWGEGRGNEGAGRAAARRAWWAWGAGAAPRALSHWTLGCARAVCDLGGGRSTQSGWLGTDSAALHGGPQAGRGREVGLLKSKLPKTPLSAHRCLLLGNGGPGQGTACLRNQKTKRVLVRDITRNDLANVVTE